MLRHIKTLNLTASILPRFPCHWKPIEWQVAKIETEKLLAATVRSELENRRSSGFLGILVPCGTSEANNWTCKSSGEESYKCHADWKEPCSGIRAPFLLNSMHLDTKVERACTTLICHLQNGIASCCTSS